MDAYERWCAQQASPKYQREQMAVWAKLCRMCLEQMRNHPDWVMAKRSFTGILNTFLCNLADLKRHADQLRQLRKEMTHAAVL